MIIRNIFFLITGLIFYSCNYSSGEPEQLPSAELHLLDFTISDCQSECLLDTGKVINKSLSGDTLTLSLGHWMNCAWTEGYFNGIQFNGDSLNIDLDRPLEEVEVDENGIEYKIYAATDCNCYFFIDLTLKKITEMPHTILLNNRKVENVSPY